MMFQLKALSSPWRSLKAWKDKEQSSKLKVHQETEKEIEQGVTESH